MLNIIKKFDPKVKRIYAYNLLGTLLKLKIIKGKVYLRSDCAIEVLYET